MINQQESIVQDGFSLTDFIGADTLSKVSAIVGAQGVGRLVYEGRRQQLKGVAINNFAFSVEKAVAELDQIPMFFKYNGATRFTEIMDDLYILAYSHGQQEEVFNFIRGVQTNFADDITLSQIQIRHPNEYAAIMERIAEIQDRLIKRGRDYIKTMTKVYADNPVIYRALKSKRLNTIQLRQKVIQLIPNVHVEDYVKQVVNRLGVAKEALSKPFKLVTGFMSKPIDFLYKGWDKVTSIVRTITTPIINYFPRTANVMKLLGGRLSFLLAPEASILFSFASQLYLGLTIDDELDNVLYNYIPIKDEDITELMNENPGVTESVHELVESSFSGSPLHGQMTNMKKWVLEHVFSTQKDLFSKLMISYFQRAEFYVAAMQLYTTLPPQMINVFEYAFLQHLLMGNITFLREQKEIQKEMEKESGEKSEESKKIFPTISAKSIQMWLLSGDPESKKMVSALKRAYLSKLIKYEAHIVKSPEEDPDFYATGFKTLGGYYYWWNHFIPHHFFTTEHQKSIDRDFSYLSLADVQAMEKRYDELKPLYPQEAHASMKMDQKGDLTDLKFKPTDGGNDQKKGNQNLVAATSILLIAFGVIASAGYTLG